MRWICRFIPRCKRRHNVKVGLREIQNYYTHGW